MDGESRTLRVIWSSTPTASCVVAFSILSFHLANASSPRFFNAHSFSFLNVFFFLTSHFPQSSPGAATSLTARSPPSTTGGGGAVRFEQVERMHLERKLLTERAQQVENRVKYLEVRKENGLKLVEFVYVQCEGVYLNERQWRECAFSVETMRSNRNVAFSKVSTLFCLCIPLVRSRRKRSTKPSSRSASKRSSPVRSLRVDRSASTTYCSTDRCAENLHGGR